VGFVSGKRWMNNRKLRALLRPLKNTPFHPQWFAFRDQHRDRNWVSAAAHGCVLDIGCADGWAQEVLSQCDYVGLDYPSTASGLYGTRPQLFADAAALPFVPSSFDTVLLLEVLEHVADAQQVLAEISRVLKPGGTLLISMPFLYPLHDAPHDYRRYTAPGLNKMLLRAGLQPGDILRRNAGFKTAALLSAIACAEFVIGALHTRRWRLLLTPLFVLAIPVINILGWTFALAGDGHILASGHATQARKPR
jgi:SAM-dependent methyltransferase